MVSKNPKISPRLVRARKIQKEIFSLQKKLDRSILSIAKKDLLSSHSIVGDTTTLNASKLQRKFKTSYTTAKTLLNKLIIDGVLQFKEDRRNVEVKKKDDQQAL